MLVPLIVLGVGMAVPGSAADGDTPVRLTVTIMDVASDEGLVQVGLYEAEGFPVVGEEIVGEPVPASAGTVRTSLLAPGAGTYAVAVYHDVNANGELDTNLLGIPKETYAFSNNVYGLFGAPRFTKASFVLEEEAEISISLAE